LGTFFSFEEVFLYKFRLSGVYWGETLRKKGRNRPARWPDKTLMDQPDANANWCQSLYESKAAGLVLYGRALGLSHSEAEDVLQETFLGLLQLDSRPEEPEHYSFRSFRNRALNYRRGIWRRIKRELEARSWFERSANADEAELEAMQRLAELPAEQREVIVLKIWNELTFEAIGQLLELSPNTVAGRYRYGLNKLKTSLQGKQYERARCFRETVAVMDASTPVG
jgi:RNA polymerase sigma-70 factor, ECF subfamily